MIQTSRSEWWIIALRGFIAVIFGVLALAVYGFRLRKLRPWDQRLRVVQM